MSQASNLDRYATTASVCLPSTILVIINNSMLSYEQLLYNEGMNMVQLGMSAENVAKVLNTVSGDDLGGESINDSPLRIVWNTKKLDFINDFKAERLVWTNAPTRAKKARKLPRT